VVVEFEFYHHRISALDLTGVRLPSERNTRLSRPA